MSEISEKTLKEIEEKKIVPQSHWNFILKNGVFWFLFLISIIIGSLAVATIIFMLTDYDWEAYKYMDKTQIEYIFLAIPYFWVIILIIFLTFAYYNFRHTRKGYIYEFYVVIVVNLFASVLLGTSLFFDGFDPEINEALLKNVPLYHKCVCTKEDIWDLPDKGLLGGKVTMIKNQDEFTLRDFHGNFWEVELENNKWPEEIPFQSGVEIKMVGQREGANIFWARGIGLWNGKP